jgi:chromosome transmission fidelity protein 8
LEGKIVNLPKPLAILQRTCVVPPPTNPHEKTSDEDGDIGGDVDTRHSETKDDNKSTPAAAATSYAIHTLIRKKIVFSKRPTPMVGLSAKTT